MLFAFPYALLGAVTIAGLVAIYTFRARARRKPVSSLMLWQQAHRPLQGGVRRDRLRLPPLFYIELAALALLLLAALSPFLRRPERGTLTVVCDTSASMAARDAQGDSPHQRAVRELRAFADSGNYAAVRLLLARAGGPQNGGTQAPRQAIAALAATPCRDIADTLDTTLARAAELAGPDNDILVLTDRPPPSRDALRPGLHWRALGSPSRNAAITLAERTWGAGGHESLVVAVTIYDPAAPDNRAIPLRITTIDDNATLYDATITTAGATATLRLDLPPGTPPLAIAIPADALDADNHAFLLPDAPRPLPVAIAIADAALARVVQRALDATGRAFTDAGPARLVFTDTAPAAHAAPGVWHCVLTPPLAPRLSRGPYLAERTDPLLEGVTFDGLAWNAGTNALPGRPLLYGGNHQLITCQRASRGAPIYHIISSGASDPLYRSPAWPTLIYNLVQLCAAALPGAPAPNLRVGAPVRLNAAPGASELRLTTPGGSLTLRVTDNSALWTPELAGLHRLAGADGKTTTLAVNFRAPAESDLTRCVSGAWQAPHTAERLRRTHRPYAWAAALAALLLLTLHHFILRR